MERHGEKRWWHEAFAVLAKRGPSTAAKPDVTAPHRTTVIGTGDAGMAMRGIYYDERVWGARD